MNQLLRRMAIQGSVVALAAVSGLAVTGAARTSAFAMSVNAAPISTVTDAIIRGTQGDVHNFALRVADNTERAPVQLHHWPDVRDQNGSASSADKTDHAPLQLHHWPDVR